MVINADSPIDPTPTAATALREKREPDNSSSSALANGSAGISHVKLITLSPHLAQRVYIQGPEAVIDLQHQSQSYGYFSRRYRQNEQKHNLAIGLMPSGSGDHECQTRGIEHHFQRHQDED